MWARKSNKSSFIQTDRLGIYILDESFAIEEYTLWFNDDMASKYNSHKRFSYSICEKCGNRIHTWRFFKWEGKPQVPEV